MPFSEICNFSNSVFTKKRFVLVDETLNVSAIPGQSIKIYLFIRTNQGFSLECGLDFARICAKGTNVLSKDKGKNRTDKG